MAKITIGFRIPPPLPAYYLLVSWKCEIERKKGARPKCFHFRTKLIKRNAYTPILVCLSIVCNSLLAKGVADRAPIFDRLRDGLVRSELNPRKYEFDHANSYEIVSVMT